MNKDGRTLTSAGLDGTVIVWDLATGKFERTANGNSIGKVESIAVSADGKWSASALKGKVIFHDLVTGQLIREAIVPRGEYLLRMALSPNGNMLAGGTLDGHVILWDAAANDPTGIVLGRHADQVEGLAFSADSNMLVSSSCGGLEGEFHGKGFRSGKCVEGDIRLWDITTPEAIGSPITEHKGWVYTVAFSKDGRMLASGGDDGAVNLWNVAGRRPIGHFIRQLNNFPEIRRYKVWVTSVAFSRDGTVLAAGYQDGTILLWDVVHQELLGRPLIGHHSWIYSLGFSDDGAMLTSGSADNTVIVWDIADRHNLSTVLAGHSDGRVTSMAFLSENKRLVTATDNSIVQVWDVENRARLNSTLAEVGNAASVAFSLDGQTMAVGTQHGAISLWDVRGARAIAHSFAGHRSSVSSLAFSHTGSVLASGSCTESNNGECTHGEIRLWDIVRQRQIGQPMLDNGSSISSLAFSPDGNVLASGGHSDSRLTLWDVTTQRPIHSINHILNISGIAFSPDGRKLAISTGSAEVLLLDAMSLEKDGLPLRGNAPRGPAMAFGDNILAVGSSIDNENSRTVDDTIMLWDVATRRPLGVLRRERGWASTFTLSTDGILLAAASLNGKITLWDVRPKSGVKMACRMANRGLMPDERTLYFGTRLDHAFDYNGCDGERFDR